MNNTIFRLYANLKYYTTLYDHEYDAKTHKRRNLLHHAKHVRHLYGLKNNEIVVENTKTCRKGINLTFCIQWLQNHKIERPGEKIDLRQRSTIINSYLQPKNN